MFLTTISFAFTHTWQQLSILLQNCLLLNINKIKHLLCTVNNKKEKKIRSFSSFSYWFLIYRNKIPKLYRHKRQHKEHNNKR